MIQLVPKGPKIPEEVSKALRYDNLVFFCGAGISKPNGLPLFDGLAKKVCEKLKVNIDSDPLLKIAKKKGDYAGIFDLLENGQISSLSTKPKILRKEVIAILSSYQEPFEIHEALLELSALSDNKGHRLVTTNFDRLFLKVKPELKFDPAPKLIPPRKEKWKNLTFLHGVIDEENDPEGGNLILTRTDFGLAYLHDNWASRFIVQLFQDFTVLFIGYSADDPVMNYLVSAISYENKRRERNKDTKNLKKVSSKPSIYAFVGYKEGEEKEKKDKWKSIGVEPISYKVKNDNHSLLYETIKGWAKLKKTGLDGKRIWLRQQLEKPYREETDKQKAETVISALKMDEKQAEYLPEINLSSDPDPNKKKPVDISWLKAFSLEKKEHENNNQVNGHLSLPAQQVQTGISLLEKLTQKTAHSSPYPLWEPLSSIEKNIAKWLLHYLDKKELIHRFIKEASFQNGLISLHPEFKNMLKWQLTDIEENAKEKLDERKALFWNIVLTQKDYSEKTEHHGAIFSIQDLHNEYSYAKAKELLSCLEPQVGFDTYFYYKKFMGEDLIYEPKLKINAGGFISRKRIDKTILLRHAEDFSNLLKKAMELAKWVRLIKNGGDLFYIQKPSIAEHGQNRHHPPWTYLIDLVRDSFDLAMEKDRSLAHFLLNKWQLYPYSIFYRLILYAVTRYPDLGEEMAIKLFEKKSEQTLWSTSCQNEVLKYLKKRKHSENVIKELFSLIMKGPSRSLYEQDIDEDLFIELKERSIFKRLHRLKVSRVQFPKHIEKYYNKILKKYFFKHPTKQENDRQDFPFFHTGPVQIGSEKRYNNLSVQKIFGEIKHTEPNTPPFLTDKKENFRFLAKGFPERAFEVLSKFQDNDIKSCPYWSGFIFEVSMLNKATESNKWVLKCLEKIENFNDAFIKECLWSLIHALNLKGSLVYYKDRKSFKGWWGRLWGLSITDEKYYKYSDSDFSDGALNSHLGKLSQSIFDLLWNQFPDGKIPKNGKMPEDIKKYFQTILQEGIKKDPSVFYHFGSYLWSLWFLDKEWTATILKPLMSWNKNETACKAFWSGYLHHPRLSLDFLFDFKDDIFQLIINGRRFYHSEENDINKTGYRENIADLLLVATGCQEISTIFSEEQNRKIIKNIINNQDKDILESLSRQIRALLEDSEDKSAILWSEKIKPWLEKFWPDQTNLKTPKIAQNFSLLILNCRDKLTDAFEVLKDKIEDIILTNNDYISYYIIQDEKKLDYVYRYPEELLQLLNWNFPKDKIYYNHDKQIQKILDKLKAKNPNIEQNDQYKKLFDKIK